MSMLLWDFSPDKHGASGFVHWPAYPIQAVHKNITPDAVRVYDLSHAGLVGIESNDCRERESAGVFADLALELLLQLGEEYHSAMLGVL